MGHGAWASCSMYTFFWRILMSVTEIPLTPAQRALAKAKKEIADEVLDRAVAAFKSKLRERDRAQVILDNVNREIADLEARIEQGNLT